MADGLHPGTLLPRCAHFSLVLNAWGAGEEVADTFSTCPGPGDVHQRAHHDTCTKLFSKGDLTERNTHSAKQIWTSKQSLDRVACNRQGASVLLPRGYKSNQGPSCW